MTAFLLLLFFASMLSSQSAMDISAILLSLLFLYQSWRKQDWKLLWNGFDFLFVFWFMIVALSFAINGIHDSDWITRLVEFKWILFLYVLAKVFYLYDFKEKAIKPAVIILSIASVYAIVVYFLGFDPLREVSRADAGGVYRRTGGFFSNPMTLAHTYGILSCLFIGPAIYQLYSKEKQRWWLTIGSILTVIAVLLTMTRGVWISLGVAVFVMLGLFRKRLAFLFIVLALTSTSVMYAIWPNFQRRLQLLTETNYDHERMSIWQAHAMIFKDHPIIGVGYGENTKLLPQYYQKLGIPPETLVSHAHNQYLHLLAGTGVFGCLAYFLIVVLFFRLTWITWQACSYKETFHKGLLLGSLGAQICLILGGMTESNFEHSKVKYAIITVWALVVWLAYEHRILRRDL